METRDAYNRWAETYDHVANPTRDMEADVIRNVLENVSVENILEIGCGTGKNSGWLATKCKKLTSVDFSDEMLEVAKSKIKDDKVQFRKADITKPWNFGLQDLIVCSLVLEHIEDIAEIFKQAAGHLNQGGKFYVCELHPYKQLAGSRAKFEKDGELIRLEYFIHHISEFYELSMLHQMTCERLDEWFDDELKLQPRLISFLFRKN